MLLRALVLQPGSLPHKARKLTHGETPLLPPMILHEVYARLGDHHVCPCIAKPMNW